MDLIDHFQISSIIIDLTIRDLYFKILNSFHKRLAGVSKFSATSRVIFLCDLMLTCIQFRYSLVEYFAEEDRAIYSWWQRSQDARRPPFQSTQWTVVTSALYSVQQLSVFARLNFNPLIWLEVAITMINFYIRYATRSLHRIFITSDGKRPLSPFENNVFWLVTTLSPRRRAVN